jgi:hypothetical protein
MELKEKRYANNKFTDVRKMKPHSKFFDCKLTNQSNSTVWFSSST